MRTERRVLMRSAALAPEPPTYQPNREIFWLSAEQEAEADGPALAVGQHTVRTERRVLMRSAALAPEPPTNQPNREIFWLSAEQEAWRHTQSGTHALTRGHRRSCAA